MSITGRNPKELWKFFDQIRQIPRCSKNEERARQWVLEYAKSKGFEARQDAAGNVVVCVPGTSGHEKAPTVVIQGHLDMVCEKNSDVEFDFSKDAIQLEIDGDWLRAKGTTLGADNGIGVAAGLALAEDESVVHGPLELLFTVDEETGLTGAGAIEPGMIEGRRLLNLDTEELGSFYIGCAGGGDSKLTMAVERADAPAGTKTVSVKVAGMKGGHSGVDIHEQRGNAIKVLTRILWKAAQSVTLDLADLAGGNAHNAIPREAHATLVMKPGDVSEFQSLSQKEADAIKKELGGRETELYVETGEAGAVKSIMDKASRDRVLNLLLSIPHGVEAMNYDIPGLVETSNNLATVGTSDGEVKVMTSTRSSTATALQALRDRIRAMGELAGATVVEENPYPGWQPDVDSELLKIGKQVYKERFGEEPEVKAVHAGLECGIIGEKLPGMDMISFGPTIQYPHSPDERISLSSVEKFWEFLTAFVKSLT